MRSGFWGWGPERLSADDYFDDEWDAPEQGRWKIYGLQLPDEVLEKVFHKNAERVFGQFKGLIAMRGGGG